MIKKWPCLTLNWSFFLTTPYRGPDEFLNWLKLARIRLSVHAGTRGIVQVFWRQSVHVFDLMRIRSKVLTGTVPLLGGLVQTSEPCTFLHSLSGKSLEPSYAPDTENRNNLCGRGLPEKYLPKFSYPKKSRNRKFQTHTRTLRSSRSLEIRNTPGPLPPLGRVSV